MKKNNRPTVFQCFVFKKARTLCRFYFFLAKSIQISPGYPEQYKNVNFIHL